MRVWELGFVVKFHILFIVLRMFVCDAVLGGSWLRRGRKNLCIDDDINVDF